jgi:hypothetical protein
MPSLFCRWTAEAVSVEIVVVALVVVCRLSAELTWAYRCRPFVVMSLVGVLLLF